MVQGLEDFSCPWIFGCFARRRRRRLGFFGGFFLRDRLDPEKLMISNYEASSGVSGVARVFGKVERRRDPIFAKARENRANMTGSRRGRAGCDISSGGGLDFSS